MGDSAKAERPSESRDRKLEIVTVKESNAKNHTHATARQTDDHKPKNRNKISSSTSPSSHSAWSFNDAELRRRKRVAGYNMYTFEGRLKETFRRGFRWIKAQCQH